MKINCIAVDDEPYGLKQISDYISKTPFLNLVGECLHVFDVMEVMKNQLVDLIYIDINLPEVSGLDFVKTLPADVKFIFTTAYSQFAVESYKLDAFDYLLKPISYVDFLRTATKAKEFFEKNHKTQLLIQDEKEFVFIQSEGKTHKVYLNEIVYIESINEYVRFHFDDKSTLTTYIRLKNIENFLPENNFIRVHRSFIVNINKINLIDKNNIIFFDKVLIPISKQYKLNVMEYISTKQIK